MGSHGKWSNPTNTAGTDATPSLGPKVPERCHSSSVKVSWTYMGSIDVGSVVLGMVM